MDAVTLRSFNLLSFKDAEQYLINLRLLELDMTQMDIPENVRTLRTNQLKEWREMREAALFCHFMSQRIGTTVYMAKGECQDYDFVAMWQNDEIRKYAPVQLKEVVPTHTNRNANIGDIIASLTKYVDSHNLIVAIHLNQRIHFEPKNLVVPDLKIGGLWVFGSISQGQSDWALWGDFLQSPTGTRHEYPK